ncbi:MAG: hypothetical protein Kow0029_16990 [Candidatus Rifleibacteriota bacterium]
MLNQIAGVVVFLTTIFISLEIKVKEQTELALKPFKQAEEEMKKKEKIKEADLPKKVKESKSDNKKKKEVKAAAGNGKEGDFRAGVWGMLKSKIKEKEKAEPYENRNDPYSLDYITKIGNFEVIARYLFSQNRLTGGCYILLGKKIENLDAIRKELKLKVGEPVPSWVKLDFAYYSEKSSPILNNIAAADQFFYEMYVSLSSTLGLPENTALQDLENALSRKEKIESVLAYDRMLAYTWKTPRSRVLFYFGCYEEQPYFRLEYQSIKPKQRKDDEGNLRTLQE